MTWTDFYLICFLVGLGSALFPCWREACIFTCRTSIFTSAPARACAHAGGHGHGRRDLNIGTIAAFLAWFGGTGYLLSQYRRSGLLLALGAAVLSGFLGAAIVFWFLAKFLMREDEVAGPGRLRHDRRAGQSQQRHSPGPAPAK